MRFILPVWMRVSSSNSSSNVQKPPGKTARRASAQGEVHLAQGEIVEAEAKLRRHIAIGRLLVGQQDVHADGLGANIRRTAIGRLHDRGAAARADDKIAHAIGMDRILGGDAGEFARDIVIMRIGGETLGNLAAGLVGRGVDARLGLLRRGNAREP